MPYRRHGFGLLEPIQVGSSQHAVPDVASNSVESPALATSSSAWNRRKPSRSTSACRTRQSRMSQPVELPLHQREEGGGALHDRRV
jgi:hypothetical protein